MARDKSPRGAAKGRASSRQAKARSTASSRKKSSGKTYTFEVNLTTPDLAGAKKKIRGIEGAVVHTAKTQARHAKYDVQRHKGRAKSAGKAVAGTVKKVGSAIKKDIAGGKERRDAKMRATRTKASASAKLAERKKQKATYASMKTQERKRKSSRRVSPGLG